MAVTDLNINLNATSVFYRNQEATSRYVVNRGSAGSAKSYSIIQLLIYKLLHEQNKAIIILRKTLPSLRFSTYETFLEILGDMNVKHLVSEEKQFLTYRYGTSYIRFGSVDDPEKIKSLNASYIFLEEATEFSYHEYQTIKLRLRAPSTDGKLNQMFLAFNPVDEFHWIKTKMLATETNCQEIHSTYLDNPYLDDEYIKTLEELMNQDINFYRIYALGEWGKLEGVIYTNYKTVPFFGEDAVESLSWYGVDFGYNAPCAVVQIIPTEKTGENRELYVKELLYQTGMTNSDLIAKLKQFIPDDARSRPIYCDHAEPDRIKEIRLAGFNAKPCNKGKKIKSGIDFVKTCSMSVLKDSINLFKEFQSYCWKVDKDANVLDEPIPFNDHLMDAVKYAIYSHLKKARLRLRFLGR